MNVTEPRDPTPPELARRLRDERGLDVVRDEIVSSWRQSLVAGLRPARFAPTYDGDFSAGTGICTAGGPVARRLANDLIGTDIAVVLTDGRGHVREVHASASQRRHLDGLSLARGFIWRVDVMGTNALGVAASSNGPVVVHGNEHFLDALTPLTTAAASVEDPRTGQGVGVLGLVCPVASVSSLLLPLARRTARDIEHALLDGCSWRERLLDQQFLRARRLGRGPIVAVSQRVMLTNAAAAPLLAQSEQPRLWSLVRTAVTDGAFAIGPVLCADGVERDGTVEPVRDGGETIGGVVRLRLADERRGTARRYTPRYAIGWEGLSQAERGLAELIAEGLTNREAAARLFVSRHTVDAHLRHIYSKLHINSRVELARVVAARAAAQPRVAVPC